MNRYKVCIIKKYQFKLNGIDREDIEDNVKTIMEKNILNLKDGYDENDTIISIKKIGKVKNNEESN